MDYGIARARDLLLPQWERELHGITARLEMIRVDTERYESWLVEQSYLARESDDYQDKLAQYDQLIGELRARNMNLDDKYRNNMHFYSKELDGKLKHHKSICPLSEVEIKEYRQLQADRQKTEAKING